MQKLYMKHGGVQVSGILVAAVLMLCASSLHAQTTPTGQVVQPGMPGARNNGVNATTTPANCTGQEPNTSAGNTTEPNCVAAGPGFSAPSTNMPIPDKARRVISLVRVDAVVPRPPVTLPEGDSFSTVGHVTLVKLQRPEVSACLASGRRISARAGAPTSTTCLDAKGDVLAYQECQANSTESGGCTVMTNQDIARQQTVTAQTK